MLKLLAMLVLPILQMLSVGDSKCERVHPEADHSQMDIVQSLESTKVKGKLWQK